MKVITSLSEIRQIRHELRRENKKIGFVPTMGYLHDGHLSLVQHARSENEVVVVSIFVNPTQFGPKEDFFDYPRDLERDHSLLEPYVDYLFLPETDQMYSVAEKITFAIKDLNNALCGPFRPGHFEGVLQILAKFFHLIAPHKVYLGQKDYQQCVVVQRMIIEFFFDLELVICPTVREKSGLALSSRNVYLAPLEKVKAPLFYQALKVGFDSMARGEKNSHVILKKVREFLEEKGIHDIEYLELCSTENLEEILNISHQRVVLAGAIRLGKTRLIDNILFDPHVSGR